MGRLTNNYEGCNQIILCGNETCKETCEKNQCSSCPINKAIDKLATYEDIIDEPEKIKLIDELYLERCEEINRLREELAEEYNQDSTKKNQGWIPCTERLPEEGQDVLVYFEYFRYGRYNRLFQTIGISYTYDGDWSGFVNNSSGWSQLSILAWQPLPEPYKPEEKQEEPQPNFYTERFNKVL